ncbi:MAG TPA: hypothetical protein VGH42_10310 [Verrucomicrobiae bacterium]|jgi:hypothetical protein
MKIKLNRAILILSALMALGFFAAIHAQPNGAGHASDFTSVEYYDAPNEKQMKTRLAGAEAQPLAGGLLVIKQLKLEMFDTNGTLNVVVKAPDCVYDTLNGTASSSGHLQLASGDGKFRVEGDGFLWRRDAAFLTISNNVQTIIENAPMTEKKTTP